MDKCVKCGMPIDDKTRCACEASVCYHCCSCPPDCSCGCATKTEDTEEVKADETVE